MTMTTPAEILHAVHRATGATPDEIVSKSRRHSVLFPRYIALLLLRKSRPFFSETELGQLLGLEGQGTTRHALSKARDMLENEPDFRAAYDHARESLENQPLARR